MAGKPLFTVTGDAKIIKAFKELGKKVSDEIVKPAAKRAAKKFEDAIKSRAPVLTGKLRKSVKVKTAKGPRVFAGRKVVAFATIIGQSKPTKAQARKGTRIPFYAFMQERGYHTGKRIKTAGKVTGYSPLHGHGQAKYTPGKFFVKKALKAVEGPAQLQMLAEIYRGIEEIANRG